MQHDSRAGQHLTPCIQYLPLMAMNCRQEVADCSESAYAKLKVSEAKALMMYASESELLSHAAQVSPSLSMPASLLPEFFFFKSWKADTGWLA